jgi:hypothetical protein
MRLSLHDLCTVLFEGPLIPGRHDSWHAFLEYAATTEPPFCLQLRGWDRPATTFPPEDVLAESRTSFCSPPRVPAGCRLSDWTWGDVDGWVPSMFFALKPLPGVSALEHLTKLTVLGGRDTKLYLSLPMRGPHADALGGVRDRRQQLHSRERPLRLHTPHTPGAAQHPRGGP